MITTDHAPARHAYSESSMTGIKLEHCYGISGIQNGFIHLFSTLTNVSMPAMNM